MESMAGFLLINVYALLLIVSTCIIFFSKPRLKKIEDEIYKNFLLTNLFMSLFGLALGIVVNSNFFDELIAVLFNKLYLISLILWIFLLTMYTIYVSLKDNLIKYKNEYTLFIFSCIILIILLPIEVTITNNSSAVASGYGIVFTYSIFGFGFLIQVVALLLNYRNMKNKKYIPLYLLITLGSLVLLLQIINPSLNYLINPALIFIAYIMYHTLENPDVKLLEEVHKSKEISDAANEEKTIFFYNMTQEIKAYIGDISRNADYIVENNSLDDIKEIARDIKFVTNQFISATNEMLDISKLEAANIKVYNNKYNIKNLLKEMVAIYKKKCKDKELDFRVHIDHDIPELLYGDLINFKEVLSIILDNSIRYTNNGFIELDVNVIIKNDICRLMITIEDSGKGINSEEIDLIKTQNKSLNKAEKIITLMNGTMIFSSNFGKGTKVKLILDQKIGVIENEEVLKYGDSFENIKILMIDDSDSGIKIIDKLIKGSNIKMDFAMNGKEAIDKIKVNDNYDIILLDEQLSQISALELIKKINGIRNFDIPVILLTKDNKYEYDDNYKKLGFSDYLLKPVKKDNLLNKINEYGKKKD